MSNFFANVDNNQCDKCDNNCLECIDKSAKCTKCSKPKFLENNQCIDVCPSDKYGNTNTNTCDPCNSNCLTCSGPVDNNCKSCKDGKFLDGLKNTCVVTCPDKYYEEIKGNKCELCFSDCIKCDNADKNVCLSCIPGKYLLSGKCYVKCPEKYYNNLTT